MSLTPGQQLVLQRFLDSYIPRPEYVPERDVLYTSTDISVELQDMVCPDIDDISDFMAERGCKYHHSSSSAIHGWILEPRRDSEPDDD